MTRAARLAPRQEALYAAEAQTLGSAGQRWRATRDAQAYVDALVTSEWFFDRWPHFVRCVVERRGRGSTWSTCQPVTAGDGMSELPSEGVLLLADAALTQAIVLHELAHLLNPPSAGHGVRFAETLLALVRHEMGFFAFADYLHALRAHPAFASVHPGLDR